MNLPLTRPFTHWLAHGVLASRATHVDISQAIQRARSQVRDELVHGGLLFDGERWATLFSGSGLAAWRSLNACVEASTPLSLQLCVSVESPMLPEPRTGWRVGYLELEPMDELIDALQRAAVQAGAQGEDALRRFLGLLDTSDSA